MTDAQARWFSCPRHYGPGEIGDFLRSYLGGTDRRSLLIAAAGFDPRCLEFPILFNSVLGNQHPCLLIRERRQQDEAALVKAAEINIETIKASMAVELRDLDIFAPDGHVVAGKSAVDLLRKHDFSAVTDVFLDASSMSIGASFPIAGYLWELAKLGRFELHLLVASARDDAARVKIDFADQPTIPPGFSGNGGLVSSSGSDSATLWLPELAAGLEGPLARIHASVNPKQTCPILPFPTDHLLEADDLMFEYAEHFNSAWEVDERDIVYASGNDPHDLYRSLCRVTRDRHAIFDDKSQLVISPFGSKALAVGALMAAMDQKIRVSYLEAVRYSCSNIADLGKEQLYQSHFWLSN